MNRTFNSRPDNVAFSMQRSTLSSFGLLPVFCALLSSSATAIPAFPGAEGPAAEATGGRAGEVFIVTTTAKNGTGSLADAVSKPGRFIVFAVSGIIDLTEMKNGRPHGGKLEVNYPDITIAGQTAPGSGICLKGGTLCIHASNVIVRHLRVRRGYIAEEDTGDAVELNPKDPAYVKPKFRGSDRDKTAEKVKAGEKLQPVTGVLLDHISASWATDENFTLSGHIDRCHAQWCLIAEALDYKNAKQTPQNHAFGSLFGGAGTDTRVAMHHSVYAHHRRRTPQCSAGDGSGDPPVIVDFRNNIVYDSIEALSHTGGHPIRLNFIANYYRTGPSSLPELSGKWFTMQKSDGTRLHASGNLIHSSIEASQDNWKGVLFEKKLQFSDKMVMRQPFDVPAILTHTAQEAHDLNLERSGATLPARDAVDARIVTEVSNGTGKVIAKETDHVDPWPAYASLPPLPDADHDGLPDFWERQHALNPNDASDAIQITASGYANIEHYANNTDPREQGAAIIYASAEPAAFRVWRSGDLAQPLEVRCQINDLETRVTIPAGKDHAVLPAKSSSRLVLLGDRVGCPARVVTP